MKDWHQKQRETNIVFSTRLASILGRLEKLSSSRVAEEVDDLNIQVLDKAIKDLREVQKRTKNG